MAASVFEAFKIYNSESSILDHTEDLARQTVLCAVYPP